MAIKGKVENEYGAMFEYHKISDVHITHDDTNGIVLTITVDSYMDKEARINGKSPTRRQCSIVGADFAMTPFYALLKAKFEEFKNIDDDFNNDFKKAEKKANPIFVDNVNGKINKWEEKEGENK